MFSVIFEVLPRRERFDDYLMLAKQLRPTLERMDGFIEIERFESRSRPGWILSHSAWRDEKSLVRWRTLADHHRVQQQGRDEILIDYHLRVGDVCADSDGLVHQQRYDVTEIGAGTAVTLTELSAESGASTFASSDAAGLVRTPADPEAIVGRDVFDSIYNPGKVAVLLSFKSATAVDGWSPVSANGLRVMRHRLVRVVRDYGMFDRREAPQYYPDALGADTTHPEPVPADASAS
jgi:heme-degrading monooxygenase HmoA